MITYADSYDLVQGENAPADRYEDDLLLANWNPALAALATYRGSDADDNVRNFSHAPIEADVDGFLDRVYALASRV